MKLFLDECVPEPLIELIKSLVKPDHEVDSVANRNWKSKKDVPLLQDVARKGYDVRPILKDLEGASGQRLVLLTPRFPNTGWYTIMDPRHPRQGPKYWPR